MRSNTEKNSKFTPSLHAREGFTCESCRKRVGMVIKEYGTGRWLCYDCRFSKEISKDTKGALLNNKNV